MNRLMLAVVVILGAMGFGYYAQAGKEENPHTKGNIPLLQQKRITLLEKRVSMIESFVKESADSRMDVVSSQVLDAQIDVINARLDYVHSSDQKKTLLSELLKMYDTQIDIAEEEARAPIAPGTSAKNLLTVDSRLLLLQSERIRIQIERDMLD